MTVGESIRYHRKRLKLTQAELADRVGISAQAVSKWENDAGLPDISMAVPLARALGTTTDELLRFGERRQHFEDQWNRTLKSSRADPRKMLEVSLAALKEYPWDWQFLYRAAMDLFQIAETVRDRKEKLELLGRAAAYAQCSVEMEPEQRTADWVLQRVRREMLELEQSV